MKHLYRALLKLVTVGIPVVIAACYGAPYDYRNTKQGKVLDRATHEGVTNIKVSCLLEDGLLESETYSSTDGSFYLEYDQPCAKVTAEDVDGIENGGNYAKAVIAFSEQSDLMILLDKEN